jgi:hypothetical protein
MHANSSDRSHFLSIFTPLSQCSPLALSRTRRCRRSLILLPIA